MWYNRNQKYLPVKNGILLLKLKCRILPMQDSGWVNANFTLVSRYRTKKKKTLLESNLQRPCYR